jgi:fructokinase
LQGFGLRPLFVSRIGNDRHGDEILRQMDQWRMDTSAIVQDPMHPTGQVRVSIENNQPSFDIVADAAYDFIDADTIRTVLEHRSHGPLYHGSLAVRNPVSAATLQQLRDRARHSFIDINLRAPWWNNAAVTQLFHGATWVKLNHQELALLTGCREDDPASLERAAREQLLRYNWELVIVTQGEHGAFAQNHDRTFHVNAVKVDRFVDSVGAGDAFSAVCLLGLMNGWRYERILESAAQFAAAVCGQRGATRQEPGFYQDFTRRWLS